MSRFRTRPATLLLLGAALMAGAACNLQLSTGVEARDEWTRSYPISATGTLAITTTNGKIVVDAADIETIEITAERIVKAGTEEAARQQLTLIDMKEEVGADRVSIDSTTRGIAINSSQRINYTVRVPRGVAVTLESTNADVVVTGLGGTLRASSTNGRITGTDLRGGAHATTSNGVVALTLAAVAEDGVTAETSNGLVTVTLPRGSNATVTARVSNGEITHSNLDLQVIESSRRRLDGRLGAGGPTIRLDTTNGAIRLIGQ